MTVQLRPIKKKIEITFSGKNVILPSQLQQKIDVFWKEQVKANPYLHNGEIFTVTSLREENNTTHITLDQTNFAHYLYSQRIGGLDEYEVNIIHPATLVITTDNKMVFGEMGDHTSMADVIQCCGGGIDFNDVDASGVVRIQNTAVRELVEELGIEAGSPRVESFAPRYTKIGGSKSNITVVYILRLRESSAQFVKTYAAFVKQLRMQKLEPEFKSIFCLDINEKTVSAFIQKHSEHLNEYMAPVLKAIALERD